MSKNNIVIEPDPIYFPNNKRVTKNHIYVHNKEKKKFLCVNIRSPNASVFRIEPSNSVVIPPETTFKITITKTHVKHKISKAVYFYFMCKLIEDIYALKEKGWNQSRLIDIKVKVVTKKPSIENLVIVEKKLGSSVMYEHDLKNVKGVGSRLDVFRGVEVKYGVPGYKKHNEWDITDLYYLLDGKKLISKMDLFEEIMAVYCPHCFQEKAKGESKRKLHGRCDFCLECPLCSCDLQAVKDGGKNLYYFVCYACTWNSMNMKKKIVGEDMKNLAPMVIDMESGSRKVKEYGELEKIVEKKFGEFAEKEDIKAMNLKELNATMPRYKISSGSYLLNAQKAKKKQTRVERNTTAATSLIKNADPLAKLFAEKTFNYTKIISASERRRNPNFTSIIKRELTPFRKRLLSKKAKYYVVDKEELNHVLVVKPDTQDILNSLVFLPNQNAYTTMPRMKVMYFEKFVLGEETPIDLRFINPNQSAMTIQLFQERISRNVLEIVVNTPPTEFKILGIEKNKEVAKKQEEEEKVKDKESESSPFFGERKDNTMVIKAGITVSTKLKVVKFALKAKIKFMVMGLEHETEMLIWVTLPGDIRE